MNRMAVIESAARFYTHQACGHEPYLSYHCIQIQSKQLVP